MIDERIALPIILFVIQEGLLILTSILSMYSGEILTQVVKLDLQEEFAYSILQSVDKHKHKGEILTSFYSDISTVANIGKQVLSFSSNVIIAVAGGIGLIIYQPIVFLGGSIGVLVICGINYKLNRNIGDYAIQKYESNAQYTNMLNRVAFAYEELKVQNMYGKVLEQVLRRQKDVEKTNVKCDIRIERPGRTLDFIISIVPVIGYGAGVLLLRNNAAQLSVIVTVTSYLANYWGKSVFLVYIEVLSSPLQHALTRLEQYMNYDAEEMREALADIHNIQRIEIRNVSHTYDGIRNVVNHTSFTISGHGLVGLFGDSGSGKSTLLKMLAKGIVPLEGDIRVDEMSLQSIATDSWRKQIGYMDQAGNLFSGTVDDNVCLYNEKPDYEYIHYLAERLNLIQELGEGYLERTVIEGGEGMSGGQKDRIRLLCVLSRKPRVLLLDEPGANLDPVQLRQMYTLLKEISGQSLVFCAGHDRYLNHYVDHRIDMDYTYANS